MTVTAQPPGPPPAKKMVWIPGGTFRMGSDDFYPEERPAHHVSVDGFWMDQYTVTVAEFRRFVKATGYVTVAERPLDPADYPNAKPDLLVPGSLVFQKSRGPVDLRDYHNWWAYVPGANWRHPEGPGSNLHGRDRNPITHVAYEDAEAYVRWAGKELPSEAEWEYAARGGLEGAIFAWGDEFAPRGKMMANTWQGEFPWQNLKLDGYEGTSPVGSFPPNGYGLYDMGGNVWQWTCDFFTPRHPDDVEHPCCAPSNPRVTSPEQGTFAIGLPGGNIPRRVMKGGSHLCAPNYCLRYRPAARQAEMVDTSTAHIGFRCIVRTTVVKKEGWHAQLIKPDISTVSAKNRFTKTPDGEDGLNYLCAGYKAFFQRADEPMKIIAMLLSSGRPAADVMQILEQKKEVLSQAYQNAKPDRPCPCGSQMEYQKCHGWKRPARSRRVRVQIGSGPRPPVSGDRERREPAGFFKADS